MAIAELAVNLVANTGNFVKNMNAVARDVDKTGRQMQSAGKAILGITAPIAAFGGAAFKMSSDFNKSMAAVEVMISRVATEGGKDIKALKQDVLALSSSTGKSAQEISEGMFQVISTFGNTADASNQLKVATEAALSGGATVSETIGLLGVVSKNFGDTSAEAQQKIVDLAYVTNELGVTTFQELAQSMTLVAPIAASVGVSMDELFASYSALTGVTGNTSVVSTQFRAALVSLQKPTEDMAKILQGLGYETGEALLKEQGLLGAFQAVTKEAAAKNINLGKALSSVESLSFVTALTTTQSEKFTQALLANAGAAGTGQKAYETYTTGLGSTDVKMNQLMRTSENMMIQLGDELAPVILDVMNNAIVPLMNSIQSIANSFKELDPETRKMIIQFTAWATAIGAGLIVVGKLLTILSALYKAKVLLLPLIGLLKVAVVGLAKAGFLLLLNPVGLTITAIAALAAGIYYFRDSIKDGIEWVRKFTLELGTNLQTGAKIAVKSIELMMKEIWSYISSGFDKVLNIVSDATKKVTGFFDDMYMAVVGNSIVPDMVDETISEFERMGDQMITGTDGTIKGVVSNFDGMAASINQTFSDILGDSDNFISKLGSSIHPQGFGGLMSDFMGGSDWMKEMGADFASSIGTGLKDVFDVQLGDQFGKTLGAAASQGMSAGIAWGVDVALKAGAGFGEALIKGESYGESEFKNDMGGGGNANAARAQVGWWTMGLSEIYFGLENMFSGGSKDIQTLARRAFENALNGLIDGKNIRIIDENGVIQQVDRIAMGSKDRFNKPWSDGFHQLTGEASSAFLGVGYAMQNMLGITEDVGAQMAYILAENVGGSIQNLALLLMGMEVPIEDMEAAMVQAFYEGSVSAHDFSVYMQGINQAYAEVEAAQNDLGLAIQLWLGSGGKGEQSVKSFQAVAKAALSQGISSIQEFVAHAVANGMLTAEQGDQALRAFAAHGITSMDQLANAGEATLIHILGSLQTMEKEGENSFFGMTEKINDNFESIEKNWNKIRNLPPANLEFNVKVKGDPIPDAASKQLNIKSSSSTIPVPALNSGGIISNPTLALIGERRKEAVIPLDELPSMMNKIMDRAGSVTDKIMGSVFNIDARGAVRGVGEEIKNALINFTDTRNGLLGTT